MRLRFAPTVAMVVLAVGAARGVTAKKANGGSLFQRLTRALAGTSGAETTMGAINDLGNKLNSLAEDTAAAAGAGAGSLPQMLQPGEGVDTWAVDDALQLATKAFSGDALGVFKSLGQAEGIEQVWSNPETVRALLDNVPVFKGIKKMAAIAEKDSLTAADGVAALGAFQEYLAASSKALESVLDPAKFAQKMYDYQNTQDPILRKLFDGVAKGDPEAVITLQQELVNREIGDLIDLEEFGLRGEEPDAIRMLREMAQKEDPALFKLVLGDEPLVQKYMSDPGIAWKEAQAINPELKKVAEVIAANSKRRKKRLAA